VINSLALSPGQILSDQISFAYLNGDFRLTYWIIFVKLFFRYGLAASARGCACWTCPLAGRLIPIKKRVNF
jgi:hypothetical protein